MTGNGDSRLESRVDLLEYRAAENARDIDGVQAEMRQLRTDMNKGIETLAGKFDEQIAAFNQKLSRQNLATWMLVAAMLSAAAAVFAALHG